MDDKNFFQCEWKLSSRVSFKALKQFQLTKLKCARNAFIIIAFKKKRQMTKFFESLWKVEYKLLRCGMRNIKWNFSHLWGTLKCWVISFFFFVFSSYWLYYFWSGAREMLCEYFDYIEFKAMLKYFLALCSSPPSLIFALCENFYISHIIKLCKFCVLEMKRKRAEWKFHKWQIDKWLSSAS